VGRVGKSSPQGKANEKEFLGQSRISNRRRGVGLSGCDADSGGGRRAAFKAYGAIIKGAFGSMNNFENLLISWSPLLLTTAGVLVTFSTGLWNIGVKVK